jgi:hypothetical protein
MSRWIANTLGCVAILAVCLIGWAACEFALLTHHSAALPDLAPSVAKVNLALDTVNHPCAPGPCGTLANVDKLTVKVGDLAVTSQRQVAQTGELVAATAQNLDRVGDSVQTVAAHLDRTADALTGTAQQATATLGTANQTIQGVQPVLSHLNATVADMDTRINDPNITALMAHLQSTSASADRITADAAYEADKLTHPPKAKLTGWAVLEGIVKWVHEVEPPIF